MANKKYKLDGNDYWEASGVYDIGQDDTQRNINDEVATKLATIEEGAEVNQNAFSNVTVGGTTIAADSKTDTLTLTAGSNITLTPNATNDSVTIAATDTTYDNATRSAAGLMSAADKTKLDTLDSADITDNSTVGGSTVEASLTSLKGSLNAVAKRNFILIGDSFSVGLTTSDGSTYTFVNGGGWADRAKVALENAGHGAYLNTVPSPGISGFNQTLPFLTMLQNIETDVDNNSITDIIVLGGTNDIGHESGLAEKITEFCTYAKTHFPNANIKIGCVGTNIKGIFNSTYPIFYKSCVANGVEFISDTTFIMANRTYICADDIHLTETGYIKTFPFILQAILKGTVYYYEGSSYPLTLNTSIGFSQNGSKNIYINNSNTENIIQFDPINQPVYFTGDINTLTSDKELFAMNPADKIMLSNYAKIHTLDFYGATLSGGNIVDPVLAGQANLYYLNGKIYINVTRTNNTTFSFYFFKLRADIIHICYPIDSAKVG